MSYTVPETCRILVLGSHKARLEKVFSILTATQAENDSWPDEIDIKFLAGVATFDSYRDDRNGQNVRYLLKIDYFPQNSDGSLEQSPQSLLPFFDENMPPSDEDDEVFYGISGTVIGSGLNGKYDGEKIQKFLESMSPQKHVDVVAPQPNDAFSNMLEEFAAFGQLDSDAKEEATRNCTMGPAKIAKFVIDTALKMVSEKLAHRRQKQQQQLPLQADIQQDEVVKANKEITTSIPRKIIHFTDPNKRKYSCRKCRTALFGDDDLEDPPHEPAQHMFGPRKVVGGTASSCQSLFLQDLPSWVSGDDTAGANEGKMSCPKCDTKVGHWNWSGAQCSCGTWVCPAIQIPRSKVDEVLPYRADILPMGAVGANNALLGTLLQSQQHPV